MLVESNPYLLGLTVIVSLLHTVFDFLAFKNDITFWKTRKSLEGLSVRSVFVSGFCQLVIFLYLLDNDTTWMVLLSSGVGTVIEFWKITKVAKVSLDGERFPFIRVQDRDSYTSTTKKYDDLAMRYLSWVLYPLVFGYAIYGLLYTEHKSWYSWVLSTGTCVVVVVG
jgi:Cleft lip and palate transmembrane protein 1 (CLPTM1)